MTLSAWLCGVGVASSVAALWINRPYFFPSRMAQSNPRLHTKTLGFYHAECLDGVTASLFTMRSVQLKEWHHGKSNYAEEEIENAVVEFYDVCPDVDELRELCSKARSVHIVDHHREACVKAMDLSCTIDNLTVVYVPDVCASMLMFMKQHPGKSIPPFLYHLNNNDTYKKVRSSDDLIYWLKAKGRVTREDCERLLRLYADDMEVVIQQATRYMSDAREKAAKQQAAGMTVDIEPYKVRFVKIEDKVEPNFVWEAANQADPTVHLVALYEEYKEGDPIVIKFRGDPQLFPWVNWMKLRDAIGASGGGHLGAGSLRILKPTQAQIENFTNHPALLWN